MKKYEIGLYEKAMPNSLSIEEKLFTAKKAGFDYMEISIDETDEKLKRLDMTKEERLSIINSMYKSGLPIRSICLSGHRKYPLGSSDKDTEKRSLEIMQKALDFADDIGVRIIQLAGYDVYYEKSTEDTKKRFLENLKKSAEMAEKKGVIMGFETMENDFMDTVEKSMHYVNQVNSPYLGVYPDCGNLTNAAKLYGHDVIEDIQKGRGHIFSMHLKETVPGKYREIVFGTGHVDFEKVIKCALDLGVRRFVTELWHTDDSWEEKIRQAHDMMHEIIEREI